MPSDEPLLFHTIGEDDDSKRDAQEKKWFFKRTGMMWALLASLFQTVHVVLLGKISNLLNPMQTVFFRSTSLLLFVFFLPWEESKHYGWKDLVLNLLFGVFDNLGTVAAAAAMVLISPSDASAILYNKLIPASIIAFIVLGEAFDLTDGAITILNAIGLALISKTSVQDSYSDPSYAVVGVMLSFCGLFLLSLIYTSARSLAYEEKEDACLLSFMTGCFGFVLSSAYLSFTNSWLLPQMPNDILLCVVLGIATTGSFYALGKALQTETSLLCATAITLSIPAVYLYDVIFAGRLIAWQTVVGVCLTVGSSMLLYIKSYSYKTD